MQKMMIIPIKKVRNMIKIPLYLIENFGVSVHEDSESKMKDNNSVHGKSNNLFESFIIILGKSADSQQEEFVEIISEDQLKETGNV
jgi:hypothetical protein